MRRDLYDVRDEWVKGQERRQAIKNYIIFVLVLLLIGSVILNIAILGAIFS